MARLLFLFVFYSVTCLAGDFMPLGGKNSIGEEIVVGGFPDEKGTSEQGIIYNVQIAKNGKVIKQFDNEPCTYIVFERPNPSKFNSKTILGEFSCRTSAKSVLAGTTYVLRPEAGKCPGIILYCKDGCRKEVPHRMYQDRWEC